MQALREKTISIIEELQITQTESKNVEATLFDFYNKIKNPNIILEEQSYRQVMKTLLVALRDKLCSLEDIEKANSIYDLYPTKWQKIIENKTVIKQKLNTQVTSDLFQCGRCKQRKCTYTTAQIRGGDESATIFVHCTVCGLHFRA
jgi:DNA-directed RNA polymerase subunit M/transcription elongation factor TFIIS